MPPSVVRMCPSCSSPVTIAMSACPHCGARLGRHWLVRLGSGLMAVVGSASMSMTLSACYGAPCAAGDDCFDVDDILTCGELVADPNSVDLDQDGYCEEFDCDEEDDGIHAAAVEVPGDGVDSNCDGEDDPRG